MPPSNYKYNTIESFQKEYINKFNDVDANELEILYKTANLMAILLSMVKPRKSKGLAMTVVPKVIEGLKAKYITGSGQTKSTADRVHIFETEGRITALRRGGRCKSKINPNIIASNIEKSTDEKVKIVSKKQKLYYDQNESNEVILFGSKPHLVTQQQSSSIRKSNFLNQPFQCSSTYSFLDLGPDSNLRTDSNFHLGFDKNKSIFNSFVSGYNDDDFFECLTNVSEVPKKDLTKIEVHTIVNKPTSEEEVEVSEAEQKYSEIMRNHDHLSRIFTWGRPLLSAPSISEESNGSKSKNSLSIPINISNATLELLDENLNF